MPLFPIFINLEGRRVLIVGGGHVALRKAERLSPYGADEPGDIDGAALVIAATDDPELNAAVSELCRWENVPVNVVDDIEKCSFVFPSLVRRGELSVGISTGGASPSAAQYIRRGVEQLVPEGFEDILGFLAAHRAAVKAALPPERRAGAYAGLFERCMELGRALSEEEFEEYIGGAL